VEDDRAALHRGIPAEHVLSSEALDCLLIYRLIQAIGPAEFFEIEGIHLHFRDIADGQGIDRVEAHAEEGTGEYEPIGALLYQILDDR
jgi:hypothetical protein